MTSSESHGPDDMYHWLETRLGLISGKKSEASDPLASVPLTWSVSCSAGYSMGKAAQPDHTEADPFRISLSKDAREAFWGEEICKMAG